MADYAVLGDTSSNLPSNRPWKPISGLLGLLMMATAGWMSARVLSSDGKPITHPFRPIYKMDEVLVTVDGRGPAGLSALMAGLFASKPDCIFSYGPPGKTEWNQDWAKGWSRMKEAVIYGARMGRNLAYPTGEPGDVLRGRIVCWNRGYFQSKLDKADQFREYDAENPGKGGVFRQTVQAVKIEGRTEEALWYHTTQALDEQQGGGGAAGGSHAAAGVAGPSADNAAVALPSRNRADRILLFDVDGTLTRSRNRITPQMEAFMERVRKVAYVGIVGGSDVDKQKEQLGPNFVQQYDYVFSENGLTAFKGGQYLDATSFKTHMGEERIKKLVNFILKQLSQQDLPIKRGTFVEFRHGMINVSPIGRDCTQQERDDFEKYDLKHQVRETMVSELQKAFASYNLTFSIGGQISFDIFPTGWDKTFCLKYVERDGFKEIHFFGDKAFPGGNDYEIYTHPKVVGHKVANPDETMAQLKELLRGEL